MSKITNLISVDCDSNKLFKKNVQQWKINIIYIYTEPRLEFSTPQENTKTESFSGFGKNFFFFIFFFLL